MEVGDILDKVYSMGSSVLSYSDFAQDDRFMHVKLALCSHEQVANGMSFSKELLESKMKEIDFMPIVGAIKVVEKPNGEIKYTLGSHEVELDIVDNELVYKKNTIVLGVALPNTAKFEMVSRHGDTKEYITFEALLYQEKYPQLKSVIDMDTDASMEIDNVEAKWNDNDNKYDVSNFRYVAHCLIDVPPAFKLAGVTQQFTLDDFKLEFSEMLEEIKSSLNKFESQKEGGDGVENENMEVKVDEVLSAEETTESQSTENAEMEVGTSEEETMEEVATENTEEVDEEDLAKKKKQCESEFELSHDDIRQKIWNQLNPIGEDGYRDWNYWIMEVFDTYFICQSEDSDGNYYKFKFSKNQETEEVSIDMESKTEVFVTYLTQEEKDELNKKDSEFNALTDSFATLTSEVESLRQFKSNIETVQAKEKADMELKAKESEIAKFSKELSKKEIESVIDDINNFSLEEITNKLSVVLANKLLSKDNTFSEKLVDIDNTKKTYSREERLISELKSKRK